MDIDSRHPIRHRLPPGGNGERAGLTLTWVSGYHRSHMGETTHHLFALSRTLRIKLTFGFSISTVISISPLPAVLDYYSELSDFHGISRAEGPTQLTWMSANWKLVYRWREERLNEAAGAADATHAILQRAWAATMSRIDFRLFLLSPKHSMYCRRKSIQFP